MIAQHMRFTAGAVLPTSDFLAHVGDWTGLPPSDLLGLMRGSAEVSSGGSDEMARLKGAFARDASARKILESADDPAQTLEKLRSLGGETGAAISGYLDLVGHRLIDGFDIAEPTALELPDALLRAIRIAVSGEAPAASDLDARIAEVRGQVPAAHQDEFDELLGEARLTYRLRDERGVYSDIWAAGLMRRAALAAGRRITKRGRLAGPHQMLDASLDEMCALVAGTGGPSADELAGRAKYRATYTAKDAPALLGPPAPPPPDLAALPPSVGRVCARCSSASATSSAALRRRTRTRSFTALRRARAFMRVPPAASPGPPSSARSPRATCSSRNRRLRPLTSFFRSSVGSSPTMAACFHMRRSSRANTASPELLAPVRRPSGSPMASVFALMGMPARSRCSGEEGRPLQQGTRDIAVWVEGRGAWRRRAQGSPGPPGVALSGDLVEAVASGNEKAIENVAKAIASLQAPFAVRSSAVDEDGAAASFAGQHLTVLNVHSAGDVPELSAKSGGPQTRTRRSPIASVSACSLGRALA